MLTFFNIAVSLWGFGGALAGTALNNDDALLGWKIAYFGGFLIGTLFYHLMLIFCNKRGTWFLVFAYLQSIGLILILFFAPQYLFREFYIVQGILYNRATLTMFVGYAVYFCIVAVTFLSLLKQADRVGREDKIALRYVTWGFLIGFLGGTIVFLPSLGVKFIYPCGYIGICIYTIVLAYAVFRHQALNLKIALKKTLYYSSLGLAVTTIYVCLVFGLYNIFGTRLTVPLYLVSSFIIFFTVALSLQPLEMYLRELLDNRFFHGTISEISEQKEKLETELERQQRLKSVGILAAGMAHEIKNPITAIKTFAEYLPTKYGDPQFRERFSQIVSREADRIQGIVTDLLLCSKPTEPHPTEVCINHMLNEILTLLTSDLMKAKVKVAIDFEPLDEKAVVDANQIKQAFLNVIMNAVDAMKETGGGELTVRTKVADQHLEVMIEDTGQGIPEDKIKHIFDPFYSNKEGGTGLGLAVTHSIIQKNNAKISVQSQTGQGTRFIINFQQSESTDR